MNFNNSCDAEPMTLSAEQELELLRAVFNSADIGICVTDQERRFVLVNPAYCLTYGYSREELIGAPFTKVLPPETRDFASKLHDEFLEGRDEVAGEWEVMDKSGRRRLVLVTAGRLALGDDTRYKVTTVTDISETRQTQRELKRLADVVSRISHGVIFTDAAGRVTWINEGTVRMTGYTLEEMRGRKPGDLLQGRDSDADTIAHMSQRLATGSGFQAEIVNYSKAGREYWLHLSCSPLLDGQGNLEGYVDLQTDITERKATESRMQELAYHDPLTSLPNRRMIKDHLNYCMAATERTGVHSALLLLDLDDFKLINDTLGPREGDRLLCRVAETLRETVYGADLVARPGGDEFVVVLTDLSDYSLEAAGQAERAAERILKALAQPFGRSELEHRVCASLGVALFTGRQQTTDELMQQADIALYQAKSAGGDTFRFFDPQMQSALLERHRTTVELREALYTDKLVPYFQGQVDVQGKLQGAELLLRWDHPERGLLASDAFIPLAEASGLIVDLGWQVMVMAARQLARWQRDPQTQGLPIAVNVSQKQLEQADFVERLTDILAEHGLAQPNLKLELTESILARDIESVRETMSAVRRLGVEFALDDFGTGYSSLAYLKRLPISQLKIDRSFINDMSGDQSDHDIVETIIALAKSLKMNTVAEGVESAAQRDFLHHLGCPVFQGYFFDRPAPIDEFSHHYGLPTTGLSLDR